MFGARGTGKSTLLRQDFLNKNTLYINLLEADQESKYALNPGRLRKEWDALAVKPTWIVIDEVQKVPKLLDIAHAMIEELRQKFILTGSSARKLKRGSANLLAGRAFIYSLYPLTAIELGSTFDLESVLHWGALPQAFSLKTAPRKRNF